MLVCIGMPVHVSACIFECTVSSNGSVCFWICLGITLVSLRRAGVAICLYVRICGGTVLGRPAPAKGLCWVSGVEVGFSQAGLGPRGSWKQHPGAGRTPPSRSHGEGGAGSGASMGGPERAAQVVSAGRQQGLGQMDWASPGDGM